MVQVGTMKIQEMNRLAGLELIDAAIKEFRATHVIGLFSGGHDSLVATHLAKQHPKFSFALHINTGIGVQATREFVRQTCQEWRIELREYKAEENTGGNGEPDPQIYEELVMERGFPGPAQHTKMYNRLKERPLRMALRDIERSRKDRTILITGVRQEESERRMRHVEPVQIWEGTKIWVAPIWDLTKIDINRYIEENGISRNPVVDLIHKSGECLCGAFASPGELKELEGWFPEEALCIRKLEQKVREAGFPWGWEDRPPNWFLEVQNGQMMLDQMLCIGCNAGWLDTEGNERGHEHSA